MKELELIKLYYYLCECYNTELRWYCQRFGPNSSPSNEKITDEEVLCIYFYCRIHENRHGKKDINGLIVLPRVAHTDAHHLPKEALIEVLLRQPVV